MSHEQRLVDTFDFYFFQFADKQKCCQVLPDTCRFFLYIHIHVHVGMMYTDMYSFTLKLIIKTSFHRETKNKIKK